MTVAFCAVAAVVMSGAAHNNPKTQQRTDFAEHSHRQERRMRPSYRSRTVVCAATDLRRTLERLALERAYISLGSNLGDREAQLRFAVSQISELPGTTVLRASKFYETDPVGPPPQGPYLNAALEAVTEREPRALLADLLAIEAAAGRERIVHWGARSLDLDILLYGDLCLSEPGLHVPHPRLHERRFVLEPLCEIAAEFWHPEQHASIRDLAERCRAEEHAARAPQETESVRLWQPEGGRSPAPLVPNPS